VNAARCTAIAKGLEVGWCFLDHLLQATQPASARSSEDPRPTPSAN